MITWTRVVNKFVYEQWLVWDGLGFVTVGWQVIETILDAKFNDTAGSAQNTHKSL